MNQTSPHAKLFGSNSMVAILELLLNNLGKQFRVNEVIKKIKVNARLVSSELKKLAETGIFISQPSGNTLLYQVDGDSPFTGIDKPKVRWIKCLSISRSDARPEPVFKVEETHQTTILISNRQVREESNLY